MRDEAKASELMAWPGAFGAVAAGLMVGVLMDDHALTGYVAGGVVVALSAAGYYLLVRRGAFVVSTILGLLVVYTSVVNDIFDAIDLEIAMTTQASSSGVPSSSSPCSSPPLAGCCRRPGC